MHHVAAQVRKIANEIHFDEQEQRTTVSQESSHLVRRSFANRNIGK